MYFLDLPTGTLSHLQVAKSSFVPVLFGHAIEDDFIQPHHSDRVFDAYVVIIPPLKSFSFSMFYFRYSLVDGIMLIVVVTLSRISSVPFLFIAFIYQYIYKKLIHRETRIL